MDITEEYTVAEAADKILAHMIFCGQPCDKARIKREVFTDLSLDHISHILDFMKNFPTSVKLFTEHKYQNGGLKATELAKDLVKQGGFVMLQKNITDLREKEKAIKDKQLQLSDLQITDLVDKVINNPRVNARAKRLEFWTIVSIILAVIAIVISILK